MIRLLLRRPLALFSLAWLVLLAIAAVLAPLIAPYAPGQQDLSRAFEGPSADHWLGTGVLGLDVFSRLVYGGRVTLLSMLISVAVYAVVGLPAGLLAGYLGGLLDRLIMRLSDVAFAVPAAIIVLVVLAVRPHDETAAMVALGLLGAPSLARVVRSATLSVREELYIRSAVASGIKDSVILARHVLPRVTSTAIVHIALFGTAAIGLETGLGFLGLGTDQVSWGELVAEASVNMGVQPWLLVPSGVLIISVILALGLLGDGLRDAAAEARTGRSPRSTRSAAVRESATGEPVNLIGDPLVSVHDLTIAFEIDGRLTPVVEGVSFQIGRGELLGLVGESGSGKSVTASAFLGLLRGTGTVLSGSMTFDGKDFDLTKPGSLTALRGRHISMVAQDPISGLDPCFTVGFQLREAVRATTGLKGEAAAARARELLEKVRLPAVDKVLGSYPHQLSGGMAQRVGIAAALAGSPELILADEPTTALDVTVQAEILDLLRELAAKGTAVLLVTHDWGVLSDLCERACVMYSGQLVEDAPLSALVHQPRHPYTAGLLASNPHFASRGSDLPAIGGSVLPPTEWPVGCRFADRCALEVEDCRVRPIPLTMRSDRAGISRCIRQDDVLPAMPEPTPVPSGDVDV